MKHFLNPDELVKELGVERGSTVLDIGCGSGHLVTALAQAVGLEGQVHAVDIDPEAISRSKNHIAHYRYSNVIFLEKDIMADDFDQYKSSFFHYICIKNVLHSMTIEQRKKIYEKSFKWLTFDGKLLISDWIPRSTLIGPPVSDRLSPKLIIQELESINFTLKEEINGGMYHYALIFETSKTN